MDPEQRQAREAGGRAFFAECMASGELAIFSVSVALGTEPYPVNGVQQGKLVAGVDRITIQLTPTSFEAGKRFIDWYQQWVSA